MKKVLLALLLTASTGALAHSHMPQEITEYSTSEIFQVDFEVGNYFPKKACFDIEINGKVFAPYRTCLNPKRTKKLNVWVKTLPDVTTTNMICSIADSDGQLRTRMCTTVNTLYPKTYLSGK